MALKSSRVVLILHIFVSLAKPSMYSSSSLLSYQCYLWEEERARPWRRMHRAYLEPVTHLALS